MGKRARASRIEANAASLETSAAYFPAESRIVLQTLRQLRGDADDRFERFAYSSADRALQSGAVSNAAARHTSDGLRHFFRNQFLRHGDILSLSEGKVAAVADPSGYGDGHRACVFKYARRAGGVVRIPIQLRAPAEIQRRKPKGQLVEGRDEIPSQTGIVALRGARIRALFRPGGLLRDSQQHLRDDPVPAHLSARLRVHGHDVALSGRHAKGPSGVQAKLDQCVLYCDPEAADPKELRCSVQNGGRIRAPEKDSAQCAELIWLRSRRL